MTSHTPMTKPPETPVVSIEVIAAQPEHESVLANLLEFYAHDFSEVYPLELGEDGRFGYANLPLYWTEPDRHPFLIRLQGKLAGFVLVRHGLGVAGKEMVWDMAEFFVLRGYRRRGIGTQVAHEVWKQFPGLWEVRVMDANSVAHGFWARAITTFTGVSARPASFAATDGKSWQVFGFVCGQVA